MHIRKTLLIHERISTDERGASCASLSRVAAVAILRNPFAGKDQDDLSDLFAIGAQLGEQLAAQVVEALGVPPVSYGKAAIVGLTGAAEHGAALLHPRFGKPVRAAIGGGQSLMPSNVKVAQIGSTIDLPLGHKDDALSFDHIDTMAICLPDAPLPDEIAVCLAMSDGSRVRARVGKGPA